MEFIYIEFYNRGFIITYEDIDRSAEINSYIFLEREEIKMKDKLQNVLLSISSKVETNKYLWFD